MRLIDADRVKERLYNGGKCISKNANPHFANGIKTAIEIIDDQPTVEKPTHGYWITDYGELYTDKCSVCSHEWGSGRVCSYCPSCGAKMDIHVMGVDMAHETD